MSIDNDIDVTPEMITAGFGELMHYSPEEGGGYEFLVDLYRAMERARRAGKQK